MASYWRSVNVPGTSVVSLKDGMSVLAVLENGGTRVEAIVRVSGVDDEGNAVGSVVDYIPKNVPTIEDVFYVFLNQSDVLEIVSSKLDKLILRVLDRQGAPWTIQAFHTPKVFTGEDVVASSPSYLDKSGRALKLYFFTLDDAISAIENLLSFRQRPALSSSDLYPSESDPNRIKDALGREWLVYKIDNPARGAVGYYAAPSIFGMPIVVGPSKSLVELSRDVKTYVGRAEASSFSDARFAAASSTERTASPTVETATADAAPAATATEEVAPAPQAEPKPEPGAAAASASPWAWVLLGVGVLGLLGSRPKR